LDYLTGEEVVPPKPKKEDYFGKSAEVENRRLTRSMKGTHTSTPSTEADEEVYDFHPMVPSNGALRWQIEYSEHNKAKEDMKLAGKLLHA